MRTGYSQDQMRTFLISALRLPGNTFRRIRGSLERIVEGSNDGINALLRNSLSWQIGAAAVAGILLSGAILVAGPVLTLAGLAGLFVFYLAITAPEFVILLLLAFVLEVIPPRLNFNFSLFIGHFFVTDMLVAMLFGILFVRMVVDRSMHFISTPLDVPLGLYCGAALIGVGVSVVSHGNSFSSTTPEARIYLYYSAFFLTTNLVRTRKQFNRLIHGTLVVGILAALIMIIEAMLGRSIMGASESNAAQGVVRQFSPGFVLCIIALVVLVCERALRNRGQWTLYLLILLFGLALVTTVTRNVLIVIAIALLGVMFFLRRSGISRLTTILLVVGTIALFGFSILLLLGLEGRLEIYILAYIERTSRMFSGTILSSQENLLIRWQEIEFAWEKIVNHPIFGIGYQTAYRPPFYAGDPLVKFLHNAYLSIWLKTGLTGLIAFLWLSISFLSRGFRHWRDAQEDILKAICLGSTLAYMGLIFGNIVAPSFIQEGAMVFAIIFGINELIYRQGKMDLALKKG